MSLRGGYLRFFFSSSSKDGLLSSFHPQRDCNYILWYFKYVAGFVLIYPTPL